MSLSLVVKKSLQQGANIVVAAKTDLPHSKLPGTIHTAAAEMERVSSIDTISPECGLDDVVLCRREDAL